MKYEVQDVKLENCRLTYDDESRPRYKERFDAFHLGLSHMNAHLRIDEYHKGYIRGVVHRFSMKEQSGLELSELKCSLVADTSKAQISGLVLQLPHSEVNVSDLTIDYSMVRKSSHFDWKEMVIRGGLERSRVTLSDLSPFIPRLRLFDDEVRFTTQVRGTFSIFTSRTLGCAGMMRLIFHYLTWMSLVCQIGKTHTISSRLMNLELQW